MIPGNLEYMDMFLRPEQHRLRVEALHEAGCECPRPHVEWRKDVGPWCANCKVVAKVL